VLGFPFGLEIRDLALTSSRDQQQSSGLGFVGLGDELVSSSVRHPDIFGRVGGFDPIERSISPASRLDTDMKALE